MRDLIFRLPKSDAKVVLDIKTDQPEEYSKALEEIYGYCNEFAVHDKVIMQVYSPDEFECLQYMGMNNFMLALWKNYHRIRSEACRACSDQCFQGEQRGFRAISMRSIHFWHDGAVLGEDIIDYVFERSPMVFLHGQPAKIEPDLIERGFGLFTHNPERVLPLLQ